jgi:hypothetical protein
MLGRRVDPPGGLQLMDLPQPLDPGVIDDLPLRDLTVPRGRTGDKRYVPVDRIVAEILGLEVAHGRDFGP